MFSYHFCFVSVPSDRCYRLCHQASRWHLFLGFSELCKSSCNVHLTLYYPCMLTYDVLCRHTFASGQDSQIGLQQGRTQHLDQALQNTSLYMTQQSSHVEASKRAGTAYLNMRSNSHEFDLTHKTGSFMYMAPEVFKERKYNEKVSQPSQLIPFVPNAWLQ